MTTARQQPPSRSHQLRDGVASEAGTAEETREESWAVTYRELRRLATCPLSPGLRKKSFFTFLCCLYMHTVLPREVIFVIIHGILSAYQHPLAKKKACRHWCELIVDRCCSCTDLRPSGEYLMYVDGVGDTLIGCREQFYCGTCKLYAKTMERRRKRKSSRR